MKKSNAEAILAMMGLSLGLAASLRAQDATPPPQEPAQGLVGSSYSEVDLGYDKQHGSPGLLHEYDVLLNQSISRSDLFGVDGDLSYSYLSGGSLGQHDYRSEILLGATAFAQLPWGRPFLTAEAGGLTQQTGGLTSNALAYSLQAGAEVPVARALFLTPYLRYDGAPHLTDHDPATSLLPNYQWAYGLKATYRLNRDWSASIGAELDQHSSRDLGLRAGLSYRF